MDLSNDTPPHRITIQEAWCLQYNQHLGKTLLLPVEEPKSQIDQVHKDAIIRRLPDVNSKDGLVMCNNYYSVKRFSCITKISLIYTYVSDVQNLSALGTLLPTML